MSPLIRKEIRLILPFWGIAILLAVVPVLIVPMEGSWRLNESVYWTFAFGMMLLGLAPFGQEFGLGTFSSMLAQPLDRRRLWNTKILLILAAAAFVFGAFLLSNYARIESVLREQLLTLVQKQHEGSITKFNFPNYEIVSRQEALAGLWHVAKTSLLLLVVAVTGGFWTTLLFRQTGAALWFVILIPGALYVVVELVFQSASGPVLNLITAAVLSLYSIAGFLWAWRMFTNAQDSQWLGENVALLSLTPAKAQTDSSAPRRKGVLRALVRREVQSHQISLLISFGLLVLHICTLVFRRFETLNRNSELRFAIGAVPFLWLFVPWLIGCVTVAEERKLGTMESQLCLPVTRRFQFATKLTIALFLGIVLGGIMPSLLEWIGTRFHISSEIIAITRDSYSTHIYSDPYRVQEFLNACRDLILACRGLILLCIGAAFITMVSFFSSSLSRNTLHALGGAVVLGLAFFALFQCVLNGNNSDYFLWKGPLILFIGVPVAVITVIWLSFSNYKRLHAGRNVWLRALFILSTTLAFTGIAVAFIDQRPWELATPHEPLHGPARLRGPVRPAITISSGQVFALLPDGRLWVATQYRWRRVRRVDYAQPFNPENASHELKIPIPTNGVFVEGSNWVALVANHGGGDVDALRSDGTLWNILSRTNATSYESWIAQFTQEPKPLRVGSDSDWKSVASVQTGFVAVKTNGTLWGWGRNEEGQVGTNYPAYVTEPVRIDDDSDWEAVFEDQSNGALFIKRDGTLWAPEWGGPGSSLKRARTFSVGTDWLTIGGVNECRLVIRRDGTLWTWGYHSQRLFGINKSGTGWELARVGEDSDWIEVSGFPPDVVAIKGGRLIKNGTSLFADALGSPSKYSDWIATDIYSDQLVALAADGTMNMWQYASSGNGDAQVFAPTHFPFWTLNILADSKNQSPSFRPSNP